MKAPPWLMPKRPQRLLLLFGILLALVLGELMYRRWQPTSIHKTNHYRILSSARPSETEEIGDKMEALYYAYVDLFKSFPEVQQPHEVLRLKLYKDRREFRRCNRGIGWAEAFYRKPYCHAYYSADEMNPHHWMFHEGVHQLNRELAHLRLAKWADEGLAEYFSTSILRGGQLLAGQVDRNTYPVWWLEDLELSGDLAQDLKSGKVISLRMIITGRGGPSMNQKFNLYYLHWWSLMHMMFDGQGGKYRNSLLTVLREGGSLKSFEEHIGPVERLQEEWYQHLLELRQEIFHLPTRTSRATREYKEDLEPNSPDPSTPRSRQRAIRART